MVIVLSWWKQIQNMHFYFTSKTNKPTKPFITILFCYISSYWPSDIRWSNSYVTQSLEDISDKKKGHAYLSWAKLVFLIVKHGLGGIAAKGALHHIDSRTNSPRRFEHRDELHCLKHRNPWVRKERDNVLLSIGTKLLTAMKSWLLQPVPNQVLIWRKKCFKLWL